MLCICTSREGSEGWERSMQVNFLLRLLNLMWSMCAPCVRIFAFTWSHRMRPLTSKPVIVRIICLASSLISAVKTAILFVLWRRAQSFPFTIGFYRKSSPFTVFVFYRTLAMATWSMWKRVFSCIGRQRLQQGKEEVHWGLYVLTVTLKTL